MKYPELPEPWLEAEGNLSAEQQNSLEALVGCKLTYDDMTDDDVTRDGAGDTYPKSVRSYYVMGHRWVRLRNKVTGDEALVRLQSRSESREVYVSAVISPFQNGKETTNMQLRALPLGAIAATYTAREVGGTVNMNRVLALGSAIKDDPLKPLPQGRITDDAFLARIGRQYDALADKYPDDNPTKRMVKINGTSLPNVKRWVAAARKRLFLMPVSSGRKRGS